MRKEAKVSHPGSLEVRLNPERMRNPGELLRALRILQRAQAREGYTEEFYRLYGPDNTGVFPGKVSRFFLGFGDTFPTASDNVGTNNGTYTNMEASDILLIDRTAFSAG